MKGFYDTYQKIPSFTIELRVHDDLAINFIVLASDTG